MDTISRESSPSYLPIAGLIAGLVGLLLGGIALANAFKANKAATAAADQVAAMSTQVARIDSVESTASTANSTADAAARNISVLQRSTQDAFTAVAGEMGKINGELAKLQESAKRPGPTGGTRSTGPVTAGPDEYIIKANDSFAKIARAQGTSIADIQAVNPGVDSTKLKVGQKIKLPAKK
jgi:LysM repeat protein